MLSASQVFRSFGSVRAVDGVSFRVKRGELYGLIGPDGAGKTTTIRLLADCLHPTAVKFGWPEATPS